MVEVTTCPVCSGTDLAPCTVSTPEARFLHHAQVRCRTCDLLIAQPRATSGDIERYYRDHYYGEQWPDAEGAFRANASSYELYEWPLLSSLWSPWPPRAGGRIVEVGCGYGAVPRGRRDDELPDVEVGRILHRRVGDDGAHIGGEQVNEVVPERTPVAHPLAQPEPRLEFSTPGVVDTGPPADMDVLRGAAIDEQRQCQQQHAARDGQEARAAPGQRCGEERSHGR